MGRNSNYFTLWLKFAWNAKYMMTIVSYFFQTYKSRIYPEIHIIVILKEEVRLIYGRWETKEGICVIGPKSLDSG